MPPLRVPSVCGGIPLAAWQQSAHRRGKTEGRAADVRPPRRESRVLWALHLNLRTYTTSPLWRASTAWLGAGSSCTTPPTDCPGPGSMQGPARVSQRGPPRPTCREPWSARARTVARLAVGRMKRAARVRSFHAPKRLLGGCSFTRGFPTRLPAGGAPRGRRRRPLRNPAPRRMTRTRIPAFPVRHEGIDPIERRRREPPHAKSRALRPERVIAVSGS